MFNLPANCPMVPVIVGAIVTFVGWPVTAYYAYRSGFRSQRMRMEWEAQKTKLSLRAKFMELAHDLSVSISERRDNWVEFFKDNATQFVSDYQAIRPDLGWKEKKKMDEAMNSIRRFASMNPEEIYAACRTDSELFDALKKFPEK